MEVRIWRTGEAKIKYQGDTKLFYGEGQPLSLTGREQARRIGDWYNANDIDVISFLTSSTSRALHTAQIAAKKIGAPVETRKGLHALRLRYYENEPYTLFENDGAEMFGKNKPGNEQREGCVRRTITAFNNIITEQKPNGFADIFTHGLQMQFIQEHLRPDEQIDKVEPGYGVLLVLQPDKTLAHSEPLNPAA